MTITKIISGCQTGADQGALAGAKEIGLLTGGMIPFGYRTDEGPRQDLAKLYNLTQSDRTDYSTRTRWNVLSSDGTLVFGNFVSPGSKLTIRYCTNLKKPYTIIGWQSTPFPWLEQVVEYLRQWCKTCSIETLNVAGNRERMNPGIHDAVKSLIIESFKDARTET